MKYIVYILLTTIIISTTSIAYADERTVYITPYGDFCKRHSPYGASHGSSSMKHVMEALDSYYAEKGLKVQVELVHGRFIKAFIKDGGDVVDRIIFDRKTHRVRSIK